MKSFSIVNANLTDADLSGACFGDCIIVNSNLNGAKLKKFEFTSLYLGRPPLESSLKDLYIDQETFNKIIAPQQIENGNALSPAQLEQLNLSLRRSLDLDKQAIAESIDAQAAKKSNVHEAINTGYIEIKIDANTDKQTDKQTDWAKRVVQQSSQNQSASAGCSLI